MIQCGMSAVEIPPEYEAPALVSPTKLRAELREAKQVAMEGYLTWLRDTNTKYRKGSRLELERNANEMLAIARGNNRRYAISATALEEPEAIEASQELVGADLNGSEIVRLSYSEELEASTIFIEVGDETHEVPLELFGGDISITLVDQEAA